MAKEIVKAKIEFVSLCKRGKNKLTTLYKGEGSVTPETILLKATAESMEKGELTALVWVPKRLDSDKEWSGEAVTKEMAYSHVEAGFQIDLGHDNKPLSKADVFVAESFLVQKGDPRFQDVTDAEGNKVDATGAWAQIYKLNNEGLKARYRSGEWDGVSMGGVGTRRPGEIKKEIPMTPEERAALVKDVTEAVVKAITPTPPIKKPEDVPSGPGTAVYKGKLDDLKAIREFRKSLEQAQIAKSVDWTDPASIAKHEEFLVKQAEDAEAEKSSAQGGVKKSDDVSSGNPAGLDEKINKGVELGSKLAKFVNTQRGHATK